MIRIVYHAMLPIFAIYNAHKDPSALLIREFSARVKKFTNFGSPPARRLAIHSFAVC